MSTTTDEPTELVNRILQRRSAPALTEPGPTSEQLAILLQAATTVPDHGRLRPWRFVVVSGDARGRFGDALAESARHDIPDLAPEMAERIRSKAFFAPTLIALIASPRVESRVPAWEQVVSASCCGYAIVLAADALGLGAVWKSTVHRDGPELHALLDMSAPEELLGWINVGQTVMFEPPTGAPPVEPGRRRVRPDIDLGEFAGHLTVDGLRPHEAT